MSKQVEIPGYVSNTWVIDTAHSDVSFQVRKLGFINVRGRFDDFEGTIVTAENPLDSTVNAYIKTASVTTKNKTRDTYVRNDDFLKVEEYPAITFTSTRVRPDGDNFLVDGDLTIRGITKQVTLSLKRNGFSVDGGPLAGFSAYTEISRSEFGVTCGVAGAVISDKVKITLEIKAQKQD
jgi:polyisoprenoid-binding protein YceI